MDEIQSDFSLKIYKNDPVALRRYVHKAASIKTIDGCEHTGVVYTVDPLTESIILINSNNGEIKMTIIIGHAVKSMEVCSGTNTTILPDLFFSSAVELPQNIILRRKSAVRELLLKNRFPVMEVNGALNIQGILTIEPPYDTEHCFSTNEMVLLQIQRLISNALL